MSDVPGEYKTSAPAVNLKAAVAVAAQTTQLYCPQCQAVASHASHDDGNEEIFTCLVCGYQQWFTIR